MDLEKAKGVIYGLAIGDAFGRFTEFISIPAIKTKYGEKGIQDLPDPALFTDDTQMSVAIAEALIRSGEKNVEGIMEAVKEEFIKWLHSPENNRAPGRSWLTLRFVPHAGHPVHQSLWRRWKPAHQRWASVGSCAS